MQARGETWNIMATQPTEELESRTGEKEEHLVTLQKRSTVLDVFLEQRAHTLARVQKKRKKSQQ